jgi:hypothetical protein
MRYELDSRAINALPRTQPGIRKHMFAVARQVQRTAIALAPKRTGHYVRGLKVVASRGADPVVRVVSTDFKGAWIEWGAGPSPRRGGRSFVARHPDRKSVV